MNWLGPVTVAEIEDKLMMCPAFCLRKQLFFYAITFSQKFAKD